MSYVPQPGTIPYRAIEHLRSLPKGAEISTGELCEILGQPSSGMTSWLASAVGAGAIRQRKSPVGTGNLWALGNGTPPNRFGHYPEEEEEAAERALDEAARRSRRNKPVELPQLKSPVTAFAEEDPAIVVGGPERVSLQEYVEAINATVAEAPVPTQSMQLVPPPLPRARAGTAPARWGISNDAEGNAEFHLQKAGALISLDVDEFREMCAFLDRMGSST